MFGATCYTGGLELCDMTQRMVNGFKGTTGVEIAVVGQGCAKPVSDCHYIETETNEGFAAGINRAIEAHIARRLVEPKFVVVLNNDLEFPDPAWIGELLSETDGKHICTPVTDNTGIKVAEAAGPGRGTILAPMVGAFCWLVPFKHCRMLLERYGFWMFDTDFGFGYGEDDYTAAILRKELDMQTPFKVVKSSWVKHLRSVTARTVKIDRQKQFRILKEKLREL